MIEDSIGELRLLRFERLSEADVVVHAVTTRPQNMAPHRGVGRERAIYWRKQVCEVLGVQYERLTSPQQVHGPDIVSIEDHDIGRGRDGRESAVKFVDGLICDRPGVPIVLMSADCPLICVYDPKRPAVGAAHASWRGTVAGIAGNLVDRMVADFGSEPGRLIAGIAPSAGPCCYEVDGEVYRIARGRFADADDYFSAKGDRYLFDLWQANRWQLIGRGVRPENIETARLCSICDRRFWSHRRDGDNAGRFGLFVALKS